MARALKTQLPPPTEQNDFEDLCEAIAKEYWHDPTAERYGNQGHKQYGIDIVSPRAQVAGECRVLAIQCKKKKLLTGRKLSKGDIDDSLEKAEAFIPKLSRLIVATTSSKDTNIQTHIITINISRDKNSKFPVIVWFWEDIEKILQEKCPNTYLDYLMSLLPEEGKAVVSKNLLSEALRVAEELAKDNYTERAKGVLSVVGKKISQLNDPEIQIIADRIKILLLVRDEKVDEAKKLLMEITKTHKTDIYSWAMIFDRYIEDNNHKEAEKVLKTMSAIDANHPLTRNTELIYKLYTDQEIKYPDGELTGTGRENATAYLVYHNYANKNGDKEKRDFYLEKQKASVPNASSPIASDILYKVWDLIDDLGNATLENIQAIWDFILEKEKELGTKSPITLTHELNIIFEKLRLDVLVLRNFKPRYEITASLKAEAISKICKSYFDFHIYHKILDLLMLMPLDKQELSKLTGYLKKTGKEIKSDLAYLLLSHALLNDPTFEHADSVCSELSLNQQKELLDAIKAKDSTVLLSHLKGVKENMLYPLIAAIPDYEFALDIINNFDHVDNEQTKVSLTHLKVLFLTQRKGGNLLEEIKKEIQLDKQGFHLLNEVAGYAEARGLWDIETECLSHMLRFEHTDKDMVQLEARSAVSLFKLEDYKGVLEKKDTILKNFEKLHSENQKVAVKVLVLSAIKTHQLPMALKILTNTFSAVSDEFEFYYYKADIELKLEKYENALSNILEGLRIKEIVSKEMYHACYMILNEISNAGFVKNENESTVTNDVYVKISGIESWFYIGNKKEIDAIKLESVDGRYTVLWEQEFSSEVDWPGDQYQKNPPKRKIENILAEPAYVRVRSQESFNKAAQEGSPYIWGINAEDPKQAIENLKKLWTQIQQPSKGFFSTYIQHSSPLSYLAKVEGGIGNAIGKICTWQEGFIHINDGTTDTEQKQIQAAHEVLDGAPVFIDAISLLFLINTGLYKVVSENVEELFYTPSVLAYIREYASQYAQTRFQVGHISFGKNMEFIHSKYDHQNELKIKNNLLEAVDYLEQHAKKETSDFLSSKKVDIESELASCITDPVAAARAKNTNIISDDYFYTRALEVLGGDKQPFSISSMALINALYDKGKISSDMYFDYISCLLINRCKHITISPQIIKDAILVKSRAGIVTVHPKNISKLHLDLTLSVQYGVTEDLASRIISQFIVLIIECPTITIDIFREIMTEFLAQALTGRDKIFGDKVISKCKPTTQSSILIVPVNKDEKEKFNIMVSQIDNYFAEFNPLYDNVSLILVRGSQ